MLLLIIAHKSGRGTKAKKLMSGPGRSKIENDCFNKRFLLISKPLIDPQMKRISLFLFIVLFIAKTYAQAEPANYRAAVAKFKTFYNANHVDSIFNMFSPEMKSILPLATFKPTTNQLKQQYGELLTTEFVSYSGSIATYKAIFKGSIFLLNVALSDKNKLNGLFLSPYKGEVGTTQQAADPDVTESPVLQKTLGGQISGTLTMPNNVSGKIPVSINCWAMPAPPTATGTMRKRASPAAHTKRWRMTWPKTVSRPCGMISAWWAKAQALTKESQLRVDDYNDDAVTLIGVLNDDPRFSKIVLFGHGEGALVGMMAWVDQPVKGYISAEGAGEQADKMLIDQMKSKPKYQADEV